MATTTSANTNADRRMSTYMHTYAHHSNNTKKNRDGTIDETERAMFEGGVGWQGAGQKDREQTGTRSLKSESECDIEVCRVTWDLSAPHWAHLLGKWATEQAT